MNFFRLCSVFALPDLRRLCMHRKLHRTRSSSPDTELTTALQLTLSMISMAELFAAVCPITLPQPPQLFDMFGGSGSC